MASSLLIIRPSSLTVGTKTSPPSAPKDMDRTVLILPSRFLTCGRLCRSIFPGSSNPATLDCQKGPNGSPEVWAATMPGIPPRPPSPPVSKSQSAFGFCGSNSGFIRAKVHARKDWRCHARCCRSSSACDVLRPYCRRTTDALPRSAREYQARTSQRSAAVTTHGQPPALAAWAAVHTTPDPSCAELIQAQEPAAWQTKPQTAGSSTNANANRV